MWIREYAVETAAPAAALWQRWSDIATWPQWNAGVAEISVAGPFAVGTSFTMTPPDGEPITLVLSDVVPGEAFTDVMDVGDVVVTTVHRLEPAGAGRTRVIYRTEISGPAADQVGPELGPAITADFPDVLAALIAVAEA